LVRQSVMILMIFLSESWSFDWLVRQSVMILMIFLSES
jgi:hypothetical protein